MSKPLEIADVILTRCEDEKTCSVVVRDHFSRFRWCRLSSPDKILEALELLLWEMFSNGDVHDVLQIRLSRAIKSILRMSELEIVTWAEQRFAGVPTRFLCREVPNPSPPFRCESAHEYMDRNVRRFDGSVRWSPARAHRLVNLRLKPIGKEVLPEDVHMAANTSNDGRSLDT